MNILSYFHIDTNISNVLSVFKLIDDANEIKYIDDSDRWTYSQQIAYLSMIRLGLNTTPIVYYMSDDKTLYILKGYNQFKTILDYYHGTLTFVESNVYASGNNAIVSYLTTKNYYERQLFNSREIILSEFCGSDEKVTEAGIENIADILRYS